MPHQVPAQSAGSQVVEDGDLGFGLLKPILAEIAKARREGLTHGLGRVGLADGDQGHVLGSPPGASRRPGDPLPDDGDAFGDHFFGFRYPSKPCAVATLWGFWGLIARYFSRLAMASGSLFCPTKMVPRWKWGSGLAGSSSAAFWKAAAASALLPAFRKKTPRLNWTLASSPAAAAAWAMTSVALAALPWSW